MKKVNTFLMIVVIFTVNILAQNSWIESTHKDFSNGTFNDAGANMYVSHNGRVQTINRWDVNNDGAIDILCVNSHPLIEMLDMSIYWGNGKDFSIKNHNYVPANGPMWTTADDLNNDGEMDLVVANYSNGTWTDMESFVYYGGLKKDSKLKEGEWGHYPFKERILLPSSNAQKSVTGDFNKDGYKDIVIAFSGGFWEYKDPSMDGTSPSRIYWGSKNNFDPENFSNIMTSGATDVVSADLNNDGWLDLTFANGDGDSSFVYYGSEDGFSANKPKKLYTNKAFAVEVGDINNDGKIDVVFSCEKGETSYAYLNEGGVFSSNRKIEFTTYMSKDVVIEDFNKDGFSDVFFTNHQYSLTGNPNLANRLIDSYLYFGSANGFSNENRQSIQTIGAWGANAADLNNDGWVDLFVNNFQEHYSYEVPSFIYWNSKDGFKKSKRTPLYEHGSQGNTIADLNGDGFLDILITSMMGNSRGYYDESYLYFGQKDGSFNPDDKINLPGREGYEQAFSDLDDDGDVDVLLLNRGEVTRVSNEAWIYWNEDNKYNSWNMTGLPSYNGIGAQVADLDKDGFLDVIISNGKPKIYAHLRAEGTYVYWGNSDGWAITERTEVPTKLTRSTTVCDMNNDGDLDLVFGNQFNGGLATIFYGNGTRNFGKNKYEFKGSQGSGLPGVADLNKDGLLDIAFAHGKNVLIYYQTSINKFSEVQKVNVQAKTMTIGDADNDGWLDLICPYYKGAGRRSWNSTILLGGKDGYSLSNKIELPTDGGTGALLADFNRDGFNDVFFYCHRKDGSFDEIKNYGDHSVNSLLYWGSENGFSSESLNKLPNVGVHYDMGVDVGNIWDRKTEYIYNSSSYNTDGKTPCTLKWDSETPHNSSIKFQIRSANSNSNLKNAKWMGANGEGSYYTERESEITKVNGEWIEYRAFFNTDNGGSSPVLNGVEIVFE